ncbi:MAG: DJ-1/PfpI family protein [Nocardioidaceae bacterium]
MTTVVIPLYDRFTALDVVGPYQMLAFTPGVRVLFAAEEPGLVTDDCGALSLPAIGLDEVDRADILVVPGGPGTLWVLDGALPRWLARVHQTTRWTTSVCSGSIILGAAGLLQGLKAATHYRHMDKLPFFGAEPTAERVVEEPEARIITAAGVSSGIDMALRLVELIADREIAEAVQLWTKYDPLPPFDSGSPQKATIAVQDLAAAYEAAHVDAVPNR